MDNRISDGVQLQEHRKPVSDTTSTMCSISAQKFLNPTSNVHKTAVHSTLNDWSFPHIYKYSGPLLLNKTPQASFSTNGL